MVVNFEENKVSEIRIDALNIKYHRKSTDFLAKQKNRQCNER